MPPSAGVAAEPTHAPSAPTSATVLVDEARALADVQRALRDGDAARALELLGEMDARFGSGALGAERMAAQVLALCAAGRVEHGRSLADRFAAVYPGSPLSNRIRAACPR
jgi:outer membrane protein assembly factor BamD (BamD/ComL family)